MILSALLPKRQHVSPSTFDERQEIRTYVKDCWRNHGQKQRIRSVAERCIDSRPMRLESAFLYAVEVGNIGMRENSAEALDIAIALQRRIADATARPTPACHLMAAFYLEERKKPKEAYEELKRITDDDWKAENDTFEQAVFRTYCNSSAWFNPLGYRQFYYPPRMMTFVWTDLRSKPVLSEELGGQDVQVCGPNRAVYL